MEQDPETSVGNLMPAADYTQEILEDPVPIFIDQLNRYLSKIPEACQELFDIVKESYQESFIEFRSIGKEISCTDIHVKYIANLYLKERIVGELFIPHLEYDDDINQKFSTSMAHRICSSVDQSDAEGQKCLDSLRTEAGLGMIACYYLPNVTKISKGFEKEVINLCLLEEIIMKESTDPAALFELQTKFLYSGEPKQKSGSFMDHRYLSCFLYIDMAEEENAPAKIKGILIMLIDKSVVKMKAEAIQAEKLAKQQTVPKEKTERLKKALPYLEKMKKYENLYQSSSKYDEKVLYRLFLKMDIDGDGRLGKDDLWKFCQGNKILISKEASSNLTAGDRQAHRNRQQVQARRPTLQARVVTFRSPRPRRSLRRQ